MNARAAFHTHHSAHRSPCFERENITVHVNQGPSYNAWPISTSQSFWNFKFGDESLGTHRVGVQKPLMEGEQRVLGSAAGSWSNAKQNSTCDKLWPLDPSKKIQKDEGEKKSILCLQNFANPSHFSRLIAGYAHQAKECRIIPSPLPM